MRDEKLIYQLGWIYNCWTILNKKEIKIELEKDERILKLVDHLFKKFGKEKFEIRDYWDADLAAIGFADKSGENLIYATVFDKKEGEYLIILEKLIDNGDIPYQEEGIMKRQI